MTNFQHLASSGQELSPVRKYFVGSMVANVAMLQELIEQLPCQAVCVCLPHAGILKELQEITFPGKTLSVQLLTGSYPIREYFLKAREIALQRVEEHESAFPKTYRLKCNPTINFKPLAVRHLSLTMVYSELTILNDFMRYMPDEAGTRGLFLSYTVSDDDLATCFPDNPATQPATQKVSTCPVPIRVPMISDKALMKAYRYREYKHVSFLFRKTSRFLKYHINDQKMRLKPPLLKTWFDFKYWVKTGFDRFSSRTYDILTFIYSIDIYKVHYYSVLYQPIFEKLLADGKRIKVVIYNDSTEVFERFRDRFRSADGTLHPKLHFEHYTYPALCDFIQMNNLQFFHTLDPVAWDAMLSPERERIGHTQSAFGRTQNLISVMNHVLLNNRFSVLLGKEEDGDCMTMLKKLSVLHNAPFESVVIPSCLPEYSEVYDMMEIDHFCTHHAFVKKLFTDQNLNARNIYVVGSTEWEEKRPAHEDLSEDVKALVADSELVLGVFHQPLFTQYHRQVIYDNLVVDFPDLYRRFLAENPRCSILIKLHRSDKLQDVQAYLPPSDRIKILDFTTSNQLLYKTFDVALAIHSTTLMHSIAHGLPAICLYKYPDYQHYYDFIESMECLATNNPDEVLAWVRLFKSDEAFRQQVRRKLTAYHQSVQQAPASEQIMAVINRLKPPTNLPAMLR
jgi:hypothetical protein